MALDDTKNFCKVSVTGSYTDTDTSITLVSGDGAKLPTPPFNLVWYDENSYPDVVSDPNKEIIRVTAISADTLTVDRGQEGTTAVAHTDGTMINTITKKMLDDINTHITNTSNPHNVTASQVGAITKVQDDTSPVLGGNLDMNGKTIAGKTETEIVNTIDIIINVKNYGAVGDGSTDDTTAFENAIQDAINTGRSIFVPSGTFNISHKIIITSPVSFVSFQKYALNRNFLPIIQTASGFTDDAMFELQLTEGGVSFYGIHLKATTDINLVQEANGSSVIGAVKFYHCIFDTANVIFNSTVNDETIVFENCYSHSPINRIVNISQIHTLFFRNNFIVANEGLFFGSDIASHESIIQGNIFYMVTGKAIYLPYSSNDVIVNNIFTYGGSTDVSGGLVQLGDTNISGAATSRVKLINNYFNGGNHFQYGIDLNWAYNTYLSGNSIAYVTDKTIYMDAHAPNTLIIGTDQTIDNAKILRDNNPTYLGNKYIMLAGQLHTTGTAAPTDGTWNQGDIVWNSSPAAGGYIGWVCVTSGSPGTWKGFGTIQS